MNNERTIRTPADLTDQEVLNIGKGLPHKNVSEMHLAMQIGIVCPTASAEYEFHEFIGALEQRFRALLGKKS